MDFHRSAEDWHPWNRYLKSPPFNREIDVIKDAEFRSSNESFRTAPRELKAAGNADISHHPEIHLPDLKKIYDQMDTSTPKGLAEKVQFDVRVYFFRRRSENIHQMTRETFSVQTNPETGLQYVCQTKVELNKNHSGYS